MAETRITTKETMTYNSNRVARHVVPVGSDLIGWKRDDDFVISIPDDTIGVRQGWFVAYADTAPLDEPEPPSGGDGPAELYISTQSTMIIEDEAGNYLGTYHPSERGKMVKQ